MSSFFGKIRGLAAINYDFGVCRLRGISAALSPEQHDCSLKPSARSGLGDANADAMQGVSG